MLKWLAQSTIYRDSIEILIVDSNSRRGNGAYGLIVKPLELELVERPPGSFQPTLELPPDSARSLMQALWDAGIRPADWSSPDGEINALRKHVEFAQKVAFQLLPRTDQ